jgi:hypothetical protein
MTQATVTTRSKPGALILFENWTLRITGIFPSLQAGVGWTIAFVANFLLGNQFVTTAKYTSSKRTASGA